MAGTVLDREETISWLDATDGLFSLTEDDLRELSEALKEVMPAAKPEKGRKTQMVAQYTR